jgi:hypothetical protein
MKTDPKATAARAFVRSLNILLKFARLYGYDHARVMEQLTTAWSELRTAIPQGAETGLLLGASGAQLLLDGVPLEGSPAEKQFAQLLSAAGLASVQFTQQVTHEELAKFVHAFPTGKAKPSELAEQLKTAIADAKGIRVNEVCFVATDSRLKDSTSLAAQIAAASMGDQQDQFRKMLNDPKKLLELIAAAEGSKTGGEAGAGGEGAGPGAGEGWGGGPGAEGFGELGGGTGAGGTGGGGIGSEAGFGAGLGAGPGGGPGGGSGFGVGGGSSGSSGGAGTKGGVAGAGGGVGAGLGPGRGIGAGGGIGPGGGGLGSGIGKAGIGSGPGWGPGLGGGTGTGAGSGSRMFGGPDDESIYRILRALATFGSIGTSTNPSAATVEFQDQVSKLPGKAQETLRNALAGLAEQGKNKKLDEGVLIQLAEHLSIRFALEQFERGDVKVSAERQMLDRIN